MEFDNYDDNCWDLKNEFGIIANGGFREIHPGVYQAWIFSPTQELFQQYKIALYRKCKKEINAILANGAHRVEALVANGNWRDMKFVCSLGFVFEGTLRKYGPNKEHYEMWSRIN